MSFRFMTRGCIALRDVRPRRPPTTTTNATQLLAGPIFHHPSSWRGLSELVEGEVKSRDLLGHRPEPFQAELNRPGVVANSFYEELSEKKTLLLNEDEEIDLERSRKRLEDARKASMEYFSQGKYLKALLADGTSLEALTKSLERIGPRQFDQTMDILRLKHSYRYLPVRILRAAIHAHNIPTFSIVVHISRTLPHFRKTYSSRRYERWAKANAKLIRDFYRYRKSNILFASGSRLYRLLVNAPEPMIPEIMSLLQEAGVRLGDYAFLRIAFRLSHHDFYYYYAYKLLLSRDYYTTDRLSLIVEIYAAIVAQLLRRNFIDEAMELISTLRGHGLPPGRAIYNILINFYARRGDAEKVTSIFNSFLESGLQPDMYTLTALFELEIFRGNIEGQNAVVKAMVEREGVISPFVATAKFNDMIRDYENPPSFADARDFILAHFNPGLLVPLGIMPRVPEPEKRHPLYWHNYTQIMIFFFRSLNYNPTTVREVLKRFLALRQEMDGTDEWWYAERGVLRGLANGLSRSEGNVSLALSLTQYWMSKQRTTWQRTTASYMWQCVIWGFANARQMENAEKYLSHSIRNGMLPSGHTWTKLIRTYIDLGEHARAGFNFARMFWYGHDKAPMEVTSYLPLAVADQFVHGMDSWLLTLEKLKLDEHKRREQLYEFEGQEIPQIELMGKDPMEAFKYYKDYVLNQDSDEREEGFEEFDDDLTSLYEAYSKQNAASGNLLKEAFERDGGVGGEGMGHGLEGEGLDGEKEWKKAEGREEEVVSEEMKEIEREAAETMERDVGRQLKDIEEKDGHRNGKGGIGDWE